MNKYLGVLVGAALFAALGSGSAVANDAAYVGWSQGEPWGQMGNVHAMDDVFGAGNWDRLDFPTAVQNGLWNYRFIFMDGGDGADGEFVTFINNNRADLEAWVAAGGHLIVNAARWYETYPFDLGCGFTLNHESSYDGFAVDDTHPVYDGPFGYTGTDFYGDYLAHDWVAGGTVLMTGDHGNALLAETPYGDGWAIAGGLTLPFFGEHPLWSPNCDEFHRNLLYYGYHVPEPTSLALLLGALALVRRR